MTLRRPPVGTAAVQTEPAAVTQESGFQTDAPDVREATAQTKGDESREAVAQTDISMMSGRDQAVHAVPDVVVGGCQATVDMAVGGCQATVGCGVKESQTQCCEATHASQTALSMALQGERGVQAVAETTTDPCQTTVSMALEAEQGTQAGAQCTEQPSQTALSMALQAERGMQAVTETAGVDSQTSVSMAREAERGMQAVTETAMTDSQTSVSMAREAERGMQAVTETAMTDSQTSVSMAREAERGMQAVTETAMTDSQTSVSMAREAEAGMQAVTETAGVDSQTNVSMALQAEQGVQAVTGTAVGDSQTALSMALQAESGSQAVVESAASDCQTSIDAADKNVGSDTTHADGDSQTDSGHSQSDAPPDASQSSDAGGGSQPASQPVVDGGPAPLLPLADGYDYPPQVRDGEAQTEPVTIIIGDASFLVEQLKCSASSPSKVNAAGNQIEIELRADVPIGAPATPHVTPIRTPHNKENVARQPVLRRVIDKREESWALLPNPHLQQAAENRGELAAVGGGKFSCPFCTLTFHESPTLYDHLQNSHNEKCKSVKKAKGREGKTIMYREPTDALAAAAQQPPAAAPAPTPAANPTPAPAQPSELEPPVLVPIVPWTPERVADGEAAGQAEQDGAPPVEAAAATDDDAQDTVAVTDDTAEVAAAATPDAADVADGAEDSGQQFCCPLCPKTFAATTELEVHWAASHKAALAGGKVVRQMRPLADSEPSAKRKRHASTEDAAAKKTKKEEEEEEEEVPAPTSPTRMTRSADRPPAGRETRTKVAKTPPPPQLERQQRSIGRKK